MCRLIAAVRPHPSATDEAKSAYPLGGEPHKLVAFSSTHYWLCGKEKYRWPGYQPPWIDTMFVKVVADVAAEGGRQGPQPYLSSGFIGRLGSNCPEKTQAITIPRLASSSIDLEAAKGWIACCRDSHPRCSPRQLLAAPHFVLIHCASRKLTEIGATAPPYAALSYVWGPAPSGGSQAAAAGQRTFQLDEVEPVVEDAIRVTLGLGYEYLWVDRHCIDQNGDESVKQAQLRNMNRVYANAEVTLVAAAGQDPSAGLPGAHDDRPRKAPLCARVKGHVLVGVPPNPATLVTSSTWATRGWTYQEALLARRRLYFTDREMSYECRDLLCREAIRLPAQVQRRMKAGDLDFASWIYEHQAVTNDPSTPSNGVFDLLAEYTTRRLTYQADVLNAMLGIFQMLASRERDPMYHICGVPVLPQDDMKKDNDTSWQPLVGFINGLAWLSKRPAKRRPGFPSWSWTGWEGGVVRGRLSGINLISFSYGFDVDLSIVLPDGSAEGWNEYYDRLRVSHSDETRSDVYFEQNLGLEITADVVTVRFREDPVPRVHVWKGIVCTGDSVCEGSFLPDLKECASSLSTESESEDDENVGPTLRRRLLEETWYGVVLGNARVSHEDHDGNLTVVLIVEETQAPGGANGGCWERVGVLRLEDTMLRSGILGRRTLHLV